MAVQLAVFTLRVRGVIEVRVDRGAGKRGSKNGDGELRASLGQVEVIRGAQSVFACSCSPPTHKLAAATHWAHPHTAYGCSTVARRYCVWIRISGDTFTYYFYDG